MSAPPFARLALVACALFCAACANHVRYATESFESSARDVVHVDTVIESEAVLAAPRLELELFADETAVVRRLRTTVRSSEYTPYRSGYEMWEVPVGLVCLPVSLVLRLADALALDVLPEQQLDHLASWSVTALNPLMNLESDSRLRREEVGRETEELDRDVQRDLQPLQRARVTLALDGREPRRFSSDARGRVRAELLTLVAGDLPGRPRGLRVSVEPDGEREAYTLELPLSRELGTKLAQAASARTRARAPGAAPEQVGRALVSIDALGFPESALSLEAELRSRERANLVWLSRLEAALRP